MSGHLIVFSGLPGTGKTTLSRALAVDLGAIWLRVDSAEAAIRRSALAPTDLMDAGYAALYALAADNLALGHTVITDTVNPAPVTRDSFRATAAEAAARLTEIEVICSDTAVHRSRIEARHAADPTTPDWAAVMARDYRTRSAPRVVIDTSVLGPEEALATLHRKLC